MLVSVAWNVRPCLQRRPDRLEVRAADDAGDRPRARAERVGVGAVDPEFALLRERARQWRCRRHGGVLYRRLGLDAFEDVFVELHQSRAVLRGVLRVLKREVGRLQAEHVREVEPGLDRVQPHERAHQESGADQEHERRRQLADHQRALRAPPPTAAGRTAAAGRHRADGIVHEREARRQREQHRHRRRDDAA